MKIEIFSVVIASVILICQCEPQICRGCNIGQPGDPNDPTQTGPICNNCNVGGIETGPGNYGGQPIYNYFNTEQQYANNGYNGPNGRPIINYFPNGNMQQLPGIGPPVINYFGVPPQIDPQNLPPGSVVNYFPESESTDDRLGNGQEDDSVMQNVEGDKISPEVDQSSTASPELEPTKLPPISGCHCVGNVCNGCNIGK